MNGYALYSREKPYYADPEGKQRTVVIPVAERESNVFFVNSGGGLHNGSEADTYHALVRGKNPSQTTTRLDQVQRISVR